jgi:hypothetical protein
MLGTDGQEMRKKLAAQGMYVSTMGTNDPKNDESSPPNLGRRRRRHHHH